MNKVLVAIVALVLVLAAGLVFLNMDAGATGNTMDENSDVKTFELTGEHFKFVMDGVDNPEIRVNQGDVVRIEFTSEDGFHDWVLDEFDAATEVVGEGAPTVVEFVADEKGTFEYYCSVGQHRANGMEGLFIVE